LGERDRALRDFSEALAAVPRFAPALTNIGNLLLEEGVFDEAIAHYEAAIRADETYALAHLNLSVAYRKTGRRAAAVRELRLAHRLEGRGIFRRR
jgi:tetratricopeptide (TPR) repeat protein